MNTETPPVPLSVLYQRVTEALGNVTWMPRDEGLLAQDQNGVIFRIDTSHDRVTIKEVFRQMIVCPACVGMGYEMDGHKCRNCDGQNKVEVDV